MTDIFDEQEFYELMQQYRTADIMPQTEVVTAFEAIKTFIREGMRQERYRLETAVEVEHKRISAELEETRTCLFKAQDRNVLLKKVLKKLL